MVSEGSTRAVVERYLDAFGRGNLVEIGGCLTDDAVWDIPRTHLGAGYAVGREELLREAAKAPPGTQVSTTRMVAEGNVVVVEGTVRSATPDGTEVRLVFCDVFTLRGGKIARLTSYLAQPNPEL